MFLSAFLAHSQATENLGMAMIYTLVEIAREWLLDYNIETGVSAIPYFALLALKLSSSFYMMRGIVSLPAAFLTVALVSPV